MKNEGFTLVNSLGGGVMLFLLATVGFIYLGPEPLWIPMKGGGGEFSPRYESWIWVTIPVGALLGCIVSFVFLQKVGLRRSKLGSYISNWCLGSMGGFTILFYLVLFLSYLHPLFVCIPSLAGTSFVLWVNFSRYNAIL
jgi:hypothetical protein